MSPLLAGLCDDDAVFPPGSLPLADAVSAHVAHRRQSYAAVVGPLVLSACDLGALRPLVRGLPPGSLELSLLAPLQLLPDALAEVEAMPAVSLAAVELPVVEEPLAPIHLDVPVYAELPRDGRRDEIVAEIAYAGLRAKIRTGGVRADLYPDEQELAATVASVVHAGLAFKATAGLHHTVRNTDPTTGFEQHGFLNLLAATAAARAGGSAGDLVPLLAERDPETVAGVVRTLSEEVRESLCSFGTCSILEPVEELAALGFAVGAEVGA